VPDQAIPHEIIALADARAMARAGKDWLEADRLRAEIEAAGWRVVDRGFSYTLGRAHPPDVAIEGELRYGRSISVPSRLEEPASGMATVVLIATGWPEDLARALSGLRSHAPDGTQAVIVADGPSPAQDSALREIESAAVAVAGRLAVEVIRTSARLGHAAALNIGIRRAIAPVVIALDTSLEPVGDLVTPLAAALSDPTVAVAGGWGLASGDLRHFVDAPTGDADAIEGVCQAFRRTDAAARGPLDERFRVYRNLDIWWSLVLRDEGEDARPRRAVALPALPIVRHEHRDDESLPPAERDRLSRRNAYRVVDRFGHRTDLLRQATTPEARR
jgi:hypothetical protein